MPDIDSTVDIKITASQEWVTVAIPLAGHASEDWLKHFGGLAAHRMQAPYPVAEQREDRTRVTVKLLATSTDLHPESVLDAVSAVISKVNSAGRQFQPAAAQTEAAIRAWWARQQR